MLRSLRSQLLLSYLAVIAIVLTISSLSLFFFIVTPGIARSRALPILQQLGTINQAVRRELSVQLQNGAAPEDLESRIPELAQEYNARILMVNSESGEVLFDSQNNAWQGTAIDGDRVNSDTDFGSADGNGVITGRYTDPDNANWLIYVRPIDAQRQRLSVVIMRREQSLFQFFRESFLTPLCQSGCIAFLLAILLAWLITRSVSRPLRDMANAAEAIAEGDFGQHLALSGPQEVQRVARSFNAMSQQVQATQQSQRDFVANVSHDLKTPLTSIKGWSQAMLDGVVTTPDERKRTASIINTEAERMSRLVNQLLDLARIESGQLALRREPVFLDSLLEQVHTNLAMRASDKNIYFDLDVGPVPTLSGDFDRLMQVFTNLVDNALSHTPENGRVQISLQANQRKAMVAIRDNGKGIDDAELRRVFERFYQVDKARPQTSGKRGAGLGLAIVRELVEAHGGHIEARSRVDEGTEFIVTLPLQPPTLPRADAAGSRS